MQSKEDFRAVYDVVMGTGLADYMNKFVVVQLGDPPCHFYSRQNNYSCLKKFNIYNPGFESPSEVYSINQAPHNDHQTYSYPYSVDSGLVNGNISFQQPPLLPTIPTIGPLHVSVNSREHIVKTFHPFFKFIYESPFPKSKLVPIPELWRVSLILEIVYGGQTLIRHTVFGEFSKCKLWNMELSLFCSITIFHLCCPFTAFHSN